MKTWNNHLWKKKQTQTVKGTSFNFHQAFNNFLLPSSFLKDVVMNFEGFFFISQSHPSKQMRVNINSNILFIILYAKNILSISINIFKRQTFLIYFYNVANETKDYSRFTLCPLNFVQCCITNINYIYLKFKIYMYLFRTN